MRQRLRRSNHSRRPRAPASKALLMFFGALALSILLIMIIVAISMDTKTPESSASAGRGQSPIETWIEREGAKAVKAQNERDQETLRKVKKYMPLARSLQKESRAVQLKKFQAAMKADGEAEFWREVCVYWRGVEATPLSCLVKLHLYLTGKEP